MSEYEYCFLVHIGDRYQERLSTELNIGDRYQERLSTELNIGDRYQEMAAMEFKQLDHSRQASTESLHSE